MPNLEAEHKIVKYLVEEASVEDMDFLSKWITVSENQKIFDDYVKIHFEITANMAQPDIDKIKGQLLKKIKKDRNPFTNGKAFHFLKYAAIVLIVFGLGYFANKENAERDPDHSIKVPLIQKNDMITVELGNGKLDTLDVHENRELSDGDGNSVGSQNGSSLVYKNNSTIDHLVYNTLNIPKGKRFDVFLSDGTHIYLNAGSTLKYPVKFIDGQPRNVYLTGEGYFDVSKDKDRPFFVHVDNMSVQVLGTRFNVSHYVENPKIRTVLVEGSVELKSEGVDNGSSVHLEPGFMAEWDKNENKISTQHVDTRIYTAWIEGKLLFRNATFKEIRLSLERHYNVTIKNENTELDQQRFDATFDIETIYEVLESFDKSYAIDYEIVNNEVLIK